MFSGFPATGKTIFCQEHLLQFSFPCTPFSRLGYGSTCWPCVSLNPVNPNPALLTVHWFPAEAKSPKAVWSAGPRAVSLGSQYGQTLWQVAFGTTKAGSYWSTAIYGTMHIR
eukprot:4586099-Pyramimonas_sp.AAC.1